jgi:hypothetical protein
MAMPETTTDPAGAPHLQEAIYALLANALRHSSSSARIPRAPERNAQYQS